MNNPNWAINEGTPSPAKVSPAPVPIDTNCLWMSGISGMEHTNTKTLTLIQRRKPTLRFPSQFHSQKKVYPAIRKPVK